MSITIPIEDYNRIINTLELVQQQIHGVNLDELRNKSTVNDELLLLHEEVTMLRKKCTELTVANAELEKFKERIVSAVGNTSCTTKSPSTFNSKFGGGFGYTSK